MSEIQALTGRIAELERSISQWNSWYVAFVFGTVMLAVAVFVTQFVSMRKSKALSTAQARLILLKDVQLKSDLQDNALKTAQANQTAGEANVRAGKFEIEAARLTAENLRLEAAIEPRRLSERQQQAFSSLSAFPGRIVDIRSYSSDTEGLILATQVMEGLAKSHLGIRDNRLTIQPAGSISFGLSVEGADKALVDEIRRILSLDGKLMATSSIAAPSRSGFSVGVAFGQITGPPPAATVTVGAKPIK